MSLINDALKRAKQAQQKNAPPAAGSTLRPAEPARPVAAPRSILLPILAAAALVLVGAILIVVALSRGLRSKSAEPAESRPITVSHNDQPKDATTLSQPANISSRPDQPIQRATIQTTPTNEPPPTVSVAAPSATQIVVSAEGTNAATVVQVPAEPQLPRLQGILFNPARPTAFLNGKSVVVGGRAGEYTVVAITKQAVTVERAGQTNVLKLEE